MKHYSFAAGNDFRIEYLRSYDNFVEKYPGFQTISFRSSQEFLHFSEIFGFKDLKWVDLEDSPFQTFADLTNFVYPVMKESKYEELVEQWCLKTGNEMSFDIYGSMIFLIGIALEWNTKKHRFIICE